MVDARLQRRCAAVAQTGPDESAMDLAESVRWRSRERLHKYAFCGIIIDGGSFHLRTILHRETGDGISLPVIDVTHPAFALAMTDAEIASLSDRFVAESKQRNEMPPAVREMLK